MPDGKATIVGCGLVGGSLALALRRRRPALPVACLDLPGRLAAVRDADLGTEVDSVENLARHVAESGLVVLAAPVEEILDLLSAIAPHLRPGAIVTDVGSTKARILRRAREVLPRTVAFVGGHPIAGAERSGVEAADPLLFNQRVYVLCPEPETPPEALLFLIELVEDLLALPVTIEAEEHDRIVAMASHVPQLAAIALVDAALADDATHGLLDLVAGRGFLDLTRVAASEYRVWKGILETNAPAIREALARFERSLAAVRSALEDGGLEALWQRASERRRRMGLDAVPRARTPELRALVDRYDEQIMKALANRLRAVRKIGKLKAGRDAPVVDPERERHLLHARLEWARTLDLPPDLVEALFGLILRHSRQMQTRTVEVEDKEPEDETKA